MQILSRLIEEAQVQVDGMSQGQIELLSERLDVSPEEHCAWQEVKSLAVASGKISLEVASDLFEIIGGTPATFNKRSLAQKIVVTRIMAVLLLWRRTL